MSSYTNHAEILIPDHSLFYRCDPKKPFHGGNWSGHTKCQAHPQSKLIAKWSDGSALIAEKTTTNNSKVVALNFGAISSQYGVADYWDQTNCSNHIIMLNAIRYVCREAYKDWRIKVLWPETGKGVNYVFSDITIICNTPTATMPPP